MEYYSALKKTEIMPFATTWKDLECVILSEAREREIWYIPYMRNLKSNGTNELTYKTETDSENKLIVTREERWRWEGVCWELEIDMYTLLYLYQLLGEDFQETEEKEVRQAQWTFCTEYMKQAMQWDTKDLEFAGHNSRVKRVTQKSNSRSLQKVSFNY